MNKPDLRHIMFKLIRTKDKDKTLRVTKENHTYVPMQKQRQNYSKTFHQKICKPRDKK